VVVTGIFVVVELLLVFAVYVFHRDLEHAWSAEWMPHYTKHDLQYQEPKEKADDEERLLQGSSGKDKGGDNDIAAQLRRTRVQVVGRSRLLK